MRCKTIVCIAVVAMAMPGCASLRKDPNAELVASAKVFAATVNVLTELKAQGQLGDDEIADIGAMIHLGQKYLEQWRAAIEAGRSNAEAVTAFELILQELMKIRSAHHVVR